MDTVEEARNILAGAEKSLRGLLERGIREQRYGDIVEIARMAEGVSRLLDARRLADAAVGLGHKETSTTDSASTPVRSKNPMKTTKSSYPQFIRDGDRLVKIGWSKRNKSSYEHRTSRESVIAFARHLSCSVSEEKVFAVEELLPIPDRLNETEIPAYQVYLTLAWFRSLGIITKKGRDGYVLCRGALENGELDRAWAELPERSM